MAMPSPVLPDAVGPTMDTTLRVSGLLSVADGIGLPRFRIRIGDEIVASRMGDGGGHEITHLRHRLAFRHADMHEHAGFSHVR